MIKKLTSTILLILVTGFSSILAQNEKDTLQVYIFLAEGCPVCQSVTVEINRVYKDFNKSGTQFLGLFPGKLSSGESRDAFKKKYKLKFDLLADSSQILSKKLNVQITPEVVVLNKNSGKVVYRGLVDDSFAAVGKRRTVSKNHYLYNALEAYKNQSITSEFTEPVGCKITW